MLGRPKFAETRKIVSLSAEMAQAIEDYRFANRIKTEAEAIRRLIEAGLRAGDAIRNRKPGPAGGEGGGGKPAEPPNPPSRRRSPKPPSKLAQLRALREAAR